MENKVQYRKMKKIFKIIGLIILTLVLVGVGYCWYFVKFVLPAEPRKPKLEIPITYNIDWWSHQKALSIDSLNIEIVESNLNLFNSKSLISYKVSGHLNYEGHWQPKIKEVHISERIISNDTPIQSDRIIEITPVIEVVQNKKTNGGLDKFEFKNEHTIMSHNWGLNRIKFVCGQKEQTIKLHQRK